MLKEESKGGREGFIMEPVFRGLLASLGASEDVGQIGRLFRQLSLKELTLRPYVVPLFEGLRRSGAKVGIVSNTEAVLTRFDLDRCPILLTVDTIVLSSDVGVRKPAREIFQLALERLDAEPASAACIGNDWAADITGARGVGLTAIYLSEQATDRELAATNARGVLQATPTLESIVSALRKCGWSGGEV